MGSGGSSFGVMTGHTDRVYDSWFLVSSVEFAKSIRLQRLNLRRLCSGNEAWPIGVTSIGIHERSSREKISHVMNTGGAAHIMNDEATRKYLQAMKRLLTTMQRLFPTDPSRCMDFDGFRNAGRGAAGGGSDRLVRPRPLLYRTPLTQE